MKRAVMALVLALAALLNVTRFITSQPATEIVLRASESIRAGDDWEVYVEVKNASAGEAVMASLFNGLRRLDQSLQLGTGGVAVWQVPEDTIVQAGESLLVVRYGEIEARRALSVRAGRAKTADILTTANSLTAYGSQRAMLMALVLDHWGNTPPADDLAIASEVQFPDTSRETLDFKPVGKLWWTWMYTRGEPGRARISLQADGAQADFELVQTPSNPEQIHLSLAPDCVLSGGRDTLTLTADITDATGYPVVDGTLVVFTWPDGYGYGRVLEGRATLRVPTPQQSGDYVYRAESASVQSNAVPLRVVESDCYDG